MSPYDLLAAWFRVADWCAYNLAKDGYQAIVLKPLGERSRASTLISQHAAQSDDYMHRKTAASLASWICEPHPTLLAELFQLEEQRDASLAPDDTRRLDTQSVVEDIVFAATRWARNETLRMPACQLLDAIVRKTINGQYWNTSSYAMVTLLRYSADGATELLAEFAAFAAGPPPVHPSRPSLTQEQSFAENLVNGNPKTLAAIEGVLDEQDQTVNTELDSDSQAVVNDLLAVATAFEQDA